MKKSEYLVVGVKVEGIQVEIGSIGATERFK